MIRIARERVDDLFALAEREAASGHWSLAGDYVALARRIGTRYNVRLLPEYRELFCRGCSTYWVEGRTVRTRLHPGRRLRTCLTCGRKRRVRFGRTRHREPGLPSDDRTPVETEEGAPVELLPPDKPSSRRATEGA